MSEIEIDTDNEFENEDGPRSKKALFGRILAVGLFVVLGTFAVIHSMKDKPDPEQTAQLGLDGEPKLDSEAGSDVKPNKNDGAKKLLADNKAKPDPFADKKLNSAKPGSSFANTNPAIRTKVTDSKSTFSPASFGGKTNASVQTAKPPIATVKPAARFAQGPGVPLTTSTGGFRAGAPVVNSDGFGSQAPLIPNAIDKAKTAAQNFKNRTGNAAAKTTTQATAKAKELKNGITNRFGEFGAKAKAAIANPKSFAAPAINTNFGQRPNTTGTTGGAPTQVRVVPTASFDSSRALIPTKATASTARPSGNPFGGDSAPPIRPVNPVPKSNGFGAPANLGSNRSSFPKQNNSAPNNRSFNTPVNSQSTSRPSVPAIPVSSVRTPPSNFSNSPSSRLPTASLAGSAPPPAKMLTSNVPGERALEGIQAPALTVQKISPREIQLNSTADFEIIVKNVGRVPADNVRVFDQIPDGAQFVGATPEPTKTTRTRDVEWNIGTMRPGQEKRIKLQLKPTRPGEMGSVAHVTFATQASMRTLVTKPELEIIHQSEPRHLIGDEVILDVVVKNKGDGPAKNVLIQEDVPVQLDSPIGREIEYEIGTLLPGKSRRIRLSLKAAQVGRIQNVMYASGEGGLRAEHKINMEIVAPKLVTKTDGPTIRYLKRNVSHTLSVANQGTAPATNVELIARLPSGLRFISANNQGTYVANSHSVFWSLAELAEGGEAKVEIKTTPIEVGSQPIKFEALADLKLKSEANQPLSVEHLVDVFFDIDDVVDPIEIGSATSYKIRVVNQGTKAATNVRLLVDFPQGLLPTSIDGSLRHAINGQRVTFEPIASMSPGDEIGIVVNAKGQSKGDHRVVVNMQTDGRQTAVSKEETTRVYSDR